MSAKKKKILSEDFIRKIIDYSAGYFDENELGKLFLLIESEAEKHFFTHSSESNLLRVISGVYDKVSFISDCIKYPHYIELLISITSNSNYLTDILVRNPEYFYWIANPSRLEGAMEENEYTRMAFSTVQVFHSFGARVNALRRLKRKEILRIGAKDIFYNAPFEIITKELSFLAKSIAGCLFSLCYNEILNKYGLRFTEDRYCLISLGKLGGIELNYSSDIDLLIFYDENETLAIKKEFREILTEAILLFIESSSNITEAGYIYRVDLRLRPDGKNSPLCSSLSDYLTYYEVRGEDWERQMLIKSDFLTGSKELFGKFKNYLTPFIFPLSSNSSPLDQIKRLKSNTERDLTDKENIKLIPGGIRDIEFSVQALQLLNGGRISTLRNGNTINIIEELLKNNLLSENEAVTLKDAYTFYRKIEHYLQLMNDMRTHSIPSNGETPEKMSHYLGYSDSKIFLDNVNINLKKVRKVYNSITGSSKKEKDNQVEVKFFNRQTAEKDLEYLREGKGLLGKKEFDKRSINAFENIYGLLINYLKKSLNPDTVLKNFVRIIRQAKFSSIWYEAFRDEKFFESFLTLCEFSQKSIDLFAEDKKLRELFLSKKVFQYPDLNTLEYTEFIFILSVQFTLGMITAENISRLLKEYLQIRINNEALFLDKYKFLKGHYFIGSMGSFGSGEMTFASDIDLIFITNNAGEFSFQQKAFLEFLERLRKIFKPLKTDCRLRPEGKSGMLVWDVNTYTKYILSRARSWELQSFTKLCYVAGNKNLFDKIIKVIVERLLSEETEKLKSDLSEMRKKMLHAGTGDTGMINLKKRHGGITDIEFILQYLILCNRQFFKKFRGKDNNRILTGMKKIKPELNDQLDKLLINYKFLKSLILNNQNIFNQSSSIISKDEFKFKILAKKTEYDPGDLEKRLNRSGKEIYSVFNEIFGIRK